MTSPPQEPNSNAPLPGHAANFNRQGLLALIWVFYSIATLFVTTRLGVRLSVNRTLRLDDYWMIIAWLSFLTMCVLETIQQDSLWYSVELLAGRIAVDERTLPHMAELARWEFPVIKLFWITLWSVKASLLSMIYRFVEPFTTRRRLWYAVTVFVFFAFVGCVLSSILTCETPANYFKPGKCSSEADMRRQHFNVIFSTAVDIISDVFIMALPLSLLPTLSLDRRKKVGLFAVFTLGLFIVCFAIVRLTQVIMDSKVDIIGLTIWGTVETSIAVIVGSLPPLKSLLSRSVKKYTRNTPRKRSEASYTPEDSYALGSTSRTIMVAESIPLDEAHRSQQEEGRIYVQRMFETHIEHDPDHDNDNLSRNDDYELGMVKSKTSTCSTY